MGQVKIIKEVNEAEKAAEEQKQKGGSSSGSDGLWTVNIMFERKMTESGE